MKTTRDAFLYMKGNVKDFAQCSSCVFWFSKINRCQLHSDKDKIDGDDSCGLYVQGKPQETGKCASLTTPKQSGLVDRKVRCENCWHFSNNNCSLYENLNKKLPEVFDLETKVGPQDCCNAQNPGPKIQKEHTTIDLYSTFIKKQVKEKLRDIPAPEGK